MKSGRVGSQERNLLTFAHACAGLSTIQVAGLSVLVGTSLLWACIWTYCSLITTLRSCARLLLIGCRSGECYTFRSNQSQEQHDNCRLHEDCHRDSTVLTGPAGRAARCGEEHKSPLECEVLKMLQTAGSFIVPIWAYIHKWLPGPTFQSTWFLFSAVRY